MITRKQRSSTRYADWHLFLKRTGDHYRTLNTGRINAKKHPFLEFRNEISDKAQSVTIDHKFDEDGNKLMPRSSRVIAIFEIDGREIYTSSLISKAMLPFDSFFKTFVDVRMYEIAKGIKAGK